ncbi:MAG: phosphopyruvate hydratase [Patescibacteria group bacterium]|nr:phosphopyruvate hydratase [Patescibacteria group bacterium]
MAKITKIKSSKIIDSRGQWTLKTRVYLEDGATGVGEVPSGISTGSEEAALIPTKEAINNIHKKLAPELKGLNSAEQRKLDKKMIDLDGTENKAALGGNSILSISLAICDATAKSQNQPLYKYIRTLCPTKEKNWKMPIPMLLMLEGGEHAKNSMDFQEFMVTPKGNNFQERIDLGLNIYQTLLQTLNTSSSTTAVGTEGGFSPQKINLHDAFSLIEKAIEKVKQECAGIALDIAANSFCSGTLYKLSGLEQNYNAGRLLTFYKDLVEHHKLLISLEDPFDENHPEFWAKAKKAFSNQVEIIGDDILTTNKNRLKNALEMDLITGVIVKPNQIGTLSETLDFAQNAKENDLTVVVSHRGGETNSSFISDLAVALNANYIKTGAPARGERVAKYNRLLEIERSLSNT